MSWAERRRAARHAARGTGSCSPPAPSAWRGLWNLGWKALDCPLPDDKEVTDCGVDACTVLFPGDKSSGRDARIVSVTHNGKPREAWAYGYAISVHKAQGSQFEHVILVTMKGRHGSRKSVYTAASRARKHLTIIGDVAELEASARRPDVPRRTFLSLDPWS